MKKIFLVLIALSFLQGCAGISYKLDKNEYVYQGSDISGWVWYPDFFGLQTKAILKAIKKYKEGDYGK